MHNPELFDVIVVGGGPAGSTAASLLAKEGLRVLVLEKERFPRFHIGESMLPQSMKIWQQLGVAKKLEERFICKHGARFLCSDSLQTQSYLFSEAFDESVSYAFQVPRAEFDFLLLEHSRELGADVRYGEEVIEPINVDGRLDAIRTRSDAGTETLYRAKVFVDATGRDTFVTGKSSEKSRIPGLDKTAFFSHFRNVERQPGQAEGHIDIVVFDEGWFWNIPFRGDVNSFGFVCSASWVKGKRAQETLDAFFERTVRRSYWAGRFLSCAEKIAPVRALADYSYRCGAMGGNGWVAVGDSTGFLDPLFSTGAHLAFYSAAFAVESILSALRDKDVSAERWQAYEQRVRRGAELFLGAVQAFYKGPLKDLIFADEQRPFLRRMITSMLAGDVFGAEYPWQRYLREQYPARVFLTDE